MSALLPCPFEYSIGQRVNVKAVNADGVITQRCDRGAGQYDYQTIFWMDGKRQVEWLLSFELEAK